MLSEAKFKKVLLVLFLLCLGARLIYVHTSRQLPVMWDARIYSSAALGLIHYIDKSEGFGHPELDSPADSVSSQARFISTMEEIISGERIEWLHYEIPTVARAQHYLFLSGPVLPACLAVMFLIDLGSDFAVVRTANAILDSLCMLLLMLIAARLVGWRAAILAGIMYLIYLPFILLTGMVSPEPITVLLILLSLYMILLWYDNQKARYIYLTGLTLGLLVLTKPTGVLLFIPFAAGFLYDNRRNIRSLVGPLIKAALPFLLVTVPWFIITSMYFDRPAIRDPEYSTSNLRSSSSIVYEGYDLDYVNPDFWLAPVTHTITHNPPEYGRLLLKKFSRLWAQPYNDFELTFLMNKSVSTAVHFVIVLTALFGVFYFVVKDKRGVIFLLLIPLYYTIIHVIFHSLARYNLNAMPIVMVASSMVFIKLYDYFRELLKTVNVKTVFLKVVMFLTGGGFILFFPKQPMIDLLGGLTGVIMLVILKAAILAVMLYFLFKILYGKLGRNKSLKLAGIPAVLLMLMVLVLGSATDNWAEWKCRLNNPNQGAGVRIYFPENFRLQSGELCRVVIDMVANHNRQDPVLVTFNGQTAPFYINRPPMSDFYYRKVTFDVFQLIYDIGMEEMRSWRTIPLNPEKVNRLLDEEGYLEFIIQTGDSNSQADTFIDIFGYYPSEEPGEAHIPGISHHATSIERFVEKGDPRIWMKYSLSSDSVISYYINDMNGQKQRIDDLSPSAGRQYGRYGIFLEVMKSNEALYHY